MQNSPSQSYNHVIGMRLSLVTGTRLGTQSFSVSVQVSLDNFLVGGTLSQTQIGTGIDLNRDWNVEFMLDALACGDKEITLNKFSLCSFIASNRKK